LVHESLELTEHRFHVFRGHSTNRRLDVRFRISLYDRNNFPRVCNHGLSCISCPTGKDKPSCILLPWFYGTFTNPCLMHWLASALVSIDFGLESTYWKNRGTFLMWQVLFSQAPKYAFATSTHAGCSIGISCFHSFHPSATGKKYPTWRRGRILFLPSC